MADPEITELRAIIAARPRASEIAQMRLDADARAKAFPLPPDVSVQPVVANGVRAEWTSTPDADPSSAILYLHGGGYVICSLDSHRHLVAEVGRASGTRTLAIDYRLAPEHPFPAPVEDTVAAYRYLLESGLTAKPHRLGWRQCRRRAGGRRVAGDSRGRIAVAGLRLVHLAMGGHGGAGRIVHRSVGGGSDGAEGHHSDDGAMVPRRR